MELLEKKRTGYLEKRKILYHITKPEAALMISKELKMRRGSGGMYGGGIYFAESLEQAYFKAKHHGAHIVADVMIGVSLMLYQSIPTITHFYLKKNGFDSVIGAHSANLEYIVYNWSQVKIKEIYIDEMLIYDENNFDPNTGLYKCDNKNCINFNTCHEDDCKEKCIEKDCLMYKSYHEGFCKYKCTEKLCLSFGVYHEEDCKVKCDEKDCIKYKSYHEGFCKYKCTEKLCLSYGVYHEEECKVKCDEKDCIKYKSYHEGFCKYKCTEKLCLSYGVFHEENCKVKCDEKDCVKYKSYHEGFCKYKCTENVLKFWGLS